MEQNRTAMVNPKNDQIIVFDAPAEKLTSFWIILVFTRTNSQSEDLLKEMDFWINHIVRKEAAALALDRSDGQYFNYFFKRFNTTSCPEIIISTDRDFSEYIKIKQELIKKLLEKPKALQEFCLQIHTLIATGVTIRQIEKKLNSITFWNGLNVVYTEIKSFFSFGFKVET